MAEMTPKRLATPALLTTSAVTYYTTPANTTTVITKATFTSVSVASASVTMYLVQSGGSEGTINILANTHAIASKATWDCTDAARHVLSAGDTIVALASANTSINIRLSGYEFTA